MKSLFLLFAGTLASAGDDFFGCRGNVCIEVLIGGERKLANLKVFAKIRCRVGKNKEETHSRFFTFQSLEYSCSRAPQECLLSPAGGFFYSFDSPGLSYLRKNVLMGSEFTRFTHSKPWYAESWFLEALAEARDGIGFVHLLEKDEIVLLGVVLKRRDEPVNWMKEILKRGMELDSVDRRNIEALTKY